MPAGLTEKIIEIPIVQDDILEETEFFTLSYDVLSAAFGREGFLGLNRFHFLSDQGANVQHVAFTPQPIMRAIGEVQISEGLFRPQVQLSLVEAADFDVKLEGSGGNATPSEDYSEVPQEFTIPASSSEGLDPLPILDDDKIEQEETFELRISRMGTTLDTGTIVIQDDEFLPSIGDFKSPGTYGSTLFGFKFAVDDEHLYVGDPVRLSFAQRDNLHIYERASGNKELSMGSLNPQQYGLFGSSIAVNENWMVVGQPGLQSQGEVFLYNRATRTLVREYRLAIIS